MKRSRWMLAGALLSVLALVAAGCGGGGGGGGPSAGGQSNCTWTIGTIGALSGDFASIGLPIEHSVAYAIDQENSKGDLACKLTMEKEDSQGSPDKAPQLAQKLTQNQQLVAVVGPYFSGETLATGDIFNEAGVPFICPSCTNETIDDQGWSTFFRAVADDKVQAKEVSLYIAKQLKPQTVAIIHDNQDYSKGIADSVKADLGALNVTTKGPYIIDPNSTDYGAVVNQVKAVDPQVVFYGGYSPQAGPLAKQLQAAGVNAQFISDDGTKDPAFGDTAGSAANGALVSCPCADPAQAPAGKSFVKGMESKYNQPPGTFAAEAFDASNMVFQALKKASASDSVTDIRKQVVDYFDGVQGYQGIVKSYTFNSHGNVVVGPSGIFLYRWSPAEKNFKILGSVQDLTKG